MTGELGILSKNIRELPIATVDLETTGFNPGNDRIIEISIVRIEVDGSQQLVLDTLVNPLRPVAATEIHGITHEDLENAPIFREIAGNVVRALAGCVVASYNTAFDMKFLRFELAQVRFEVALPHLCIMHMRTILGLGSRCRLQDACRDEEVDYSRGHIASADAEAAAALLERYLRIASGKRIETFEQLTKHGTSQRPPVRVSSFEFIRSFEENPLPDLGLFNLELCSNLVSRREKAMSEQFDPGRYALGAYWDALTTVLLDLEITPDELQFIERERVRLRLRKEHVRMMHARAYNAAIARYIDDEWLDDQEALELHELRKCLSVMGWAPGD